MKEESDKEGISKLAHTLNLDRVVFIERTFSEYMRMFNLEPSQLLGFKILDCPSGASSFVAEAYNEYKIKKVIGCDVLYDWNLYADIDELRRSRATSLEKFISDYAKGIKEKRCVKARLPKWQHKISSSNILST
jgi:2-polyprenyl-3-methyl-5-hydroxy-6-metoxy-1,4-benzoquinol methylase